MNVDKLDVNWNKLGRYLAVSADEAVCAMKQLNELARKVGPYSEEELKARNMATSRFKRLAHRIFSYKKKKSSSVFFL